MRLHLPRRRTQVLLKYFFAILILWFLWILLPFGDNTEKVHVRFPPQRIPPYVCPRSDDVPNDFAPDLFVEWKNVTKTDSKVLVFVETFYSKLGKQIINVLNAAKIPYKVETLSKNLPLLATAKRGRFSVIIIENYYKYLNLSPWNRQLLDKYCRDYSVGIIAFLASRPSEYVRLKVKGSPLTLRQKQHATNIRFSPRSSVNYIAKPGAVLETNVPHSNDWVLFDILKGYESVISANDRDGRERAAVILDKGDTDNVQRILFGHGLNYWFNKIAFVDSLRFMSKGHIDLGLDRHVQIDVDDIFVGASGSRITREDADALLASQLRLRQKIDGFTYCLGFSGHYFRSGDALEDGGDERLVEIAENFLWFPHMWKHNHAHEYNFSYLEAVMTQNKLFAQGMKLPAFIHYSVSPQHAGVYPVHEALYAAWQKVWDIWVTSTEEYPHLRPASSRRGFIHNNISVLPRQTCGLYTHTHFFHSYPGGFSKLKANVEGGDLFFIILTNPYSIFMTHQQNYANDRLGTFVFERVIDFINCWTNLRLKWTEPTVTAKNYFQKFPAEKSPIWGDPCADQRHVRILPPEFNCTEMPLPNLLVVGPQKTGSTALATYLALHPGFKTNDLIPSSFEELQFFGGANYGKGILWYINKFVGKSAPNVKLFEKSATYFDNPEAPRAAAALLPKADIVIILYDPALRAYSWYRHMQAHNATAALDYTLGEILSSNSSAPAAVRRLRQRCVSPGRYVHHLERWLDFYPLTQLHIVDGEILRVNPAEALSELVLSVHMPSFPYDRVLTFDEKKGFFCISDENGTNKCLGSSKGRKYPAMDGAVREQLDQIFREDNIALNRLLLRNDLPVPNWLRNLLSQKVSAI